MGQHAVTDTTPISSRPAPFFSSARARHFSVLSAAAQNFIVSSIENAPLERLVSASDSFSTRFSMIDVEVQ
jgi:hypothetical protein